MRKRKIVNNNLGVYTANLFEVEDEENCRENGWTLWWEGRFRGDIMLGIVLKDALAGPGTWLRQGGKYEGLLPRYAKTKNT